MSGGIDGIGLTRNTTSGAPSEAADTESKTTETGGQKVVYEPSISSLVEDAQEETTVLFQEKASTTLGQREAKTRSKSRLDEILKKYVHRTETVNQAEKFQATLESLKKLGKPTSQQIRQQLALLREDSDGDDFESGMLLALEEALATEGGNDELLSAVRVAKAEVGTELRDFYQEHVKTYDGVSDVYKQLLGEYGEKDFLAATDMMIHQLGDDLQSRGTTTDVNQIKATVDSLYHLEVAKTTYSAFAKLTEKMHKEFGVFQASA